MKVDNAGAIALSIGTTTENADTGEISYDNVQKSINGFHKHVNLLRREKVSEDELNAAKIGLKNSILDCNETSADKTDTLMTRTKYGISYMNQMLDMIDKITTDDIYNMANYIFAGPPTYSILATENTLKANEEFLNKLA
jgi:predicted Zn-dependent peptidase